MTSPHGFAVTVYYEDTDMGGIVYHANYLKYIERARSDWVRRRGVDQNAMRAAGTAFVVRRIEAAYRAPAHLDDALTVTTEVVSATGARITLDQRVHRADVVLFAARVELAAVHVATGRPGRLPAALRA